MIVYRSEDLLRRYQQACHLPNSHLEVHLRELEQPERRAISQDVRFLARGEVSAYRLKNRGIRKPSDREVDIVPPKLEDPPCCLGIDIWGFIGVEALAGDVAG